MDLRIITASGQAFTLRGVSALGMDAVAYVRADGTLGAYQFADDDKVTQVLATGH